MFAVVSQRRREVGLQRVEGPGLRGSPPGYVIHLQCEGQRFGPDASERKRDDLGVKASSFAFRDRVYIPSVIEQNSLNFARARRASQYVDPGVRDARADQKDILQYDRVRREIVWDPEEVIGDSGPVLGGERSGESRGVHHPPLEKKQNLS